MAESLTFSVGIPTLNQAEFLEGTLDSLLNQRVMPLEIVISDHYSTDGTAEIIRRYEERHPGLIRGVKPPAGSNVGGQWEFTLGCLKGDWVTLLSSDDLAHPNFCEVLMRGATRRKDAVMVRAGWETIDVEGKVLTQEYLLSVSKVTLPPETLLEQKEGPKASFAAFAVKRQALIDSGGYPLGMESFGDWPMFVQLAPYGSFVYEDELVSGYRMHGGNKFRQRLGMWIRDEQRMFYEVIPRAAERLKLKDKRWIEESSRANFVRYLASASTEYKAEERPEIVPQFAEWAERVNGQELLKRFADGETVERPMTLMKRARRMLRPLAQRLHARLHGR